MRDLCQPGGHRSTRVLSCADVRLAALFGGFFLVGGILGFGGALLLATKLHPLWLLGAGAALGAMGLL
jgi:hypothetical protein